MIPLNISKDRISFRIRKLNVQFSINLVLDAANI